MGGWKPDEKLGYAEGEPSRLTKLRCALFGHDWKCLYRHRLERGPFTSSEVGGWGCTRCGGQRMTQWDG